MKEINQTTQTNGTCNACSNCGMGCTCGGMHGYHGHPVLRILLALALLGFVFAAGMKLGELKSELGLGYEHHGMMMNRGEGDYGMEEGQMMMPSHATTVVVPAAPTAPTATTTTTATH